jgi:hypothetical protein
VRCGIAHRIASCPNPPLFAIMPSTVAAIGRPRARN